MKGNNLTKYKKDLSTLYEEKINKQDITHMNKLFDIWKKFNPGDPKIQQIDQKWLKIGFQGKDPLTDFRGSGLLGLKHLWNFSLYDNRAGPVYRVATGEKSWYFYAATGINITGKVIQFIEENDCDEFFYNNNNIDLYNFTQVLYNEFFVAFNDLWIKGGHNDFMKVNSLLEEFMENKAKHIFNKLVRNKKIY